MGGAVEVSRGFRAMGSECIARVVADKDRSGPILDRVEQRMRELEHRWSRFIDDSELSQLNAHAGAPVFVSAETFEVVSLAIDAYRATGGRFDPTMLDALREIGYSTTFDGVVDREPIAVGQAPTFGSSIDDLYLDARSRMIHVPAGMHFDLGGIGKGLAADMIFDQLVADGVEGLCLDFGGDIRVGGTPLAGGGWAIAVENPFDANDDLCVLGVGDGSVTTSSRLRRSWMTTSGSAHHLLDPTTLRSSRSGLASVTVVAARAAWGEVHAKAALIAGPSEGGELLESSGLSALLIGDDGRQTTVGEFETFVVSGPTLAE